jgi:rubrerythrin
VCEFGGNDFTSDTIGLCNECYAKQRNEIDSKKNCSHCAYFDFRENPSSALCKKIDIRLTLTLIVVLPPINPGTSDGMIFRAFYHQAENCVYYIDKKEYAAKAMKGQLEPAKEVSIVVCNYCGARFDIAKSPKCPNCGAVPKSSERELSSNSKGIPQHDFETSYNIPSIDLSPDYQATYDFSISDKKKERDSKEKPNSSTKEKSEDN